MAPHLFLATALTSAFSSARSVPENPPAPSLIAGSSADLELKSALIEPSWIISGNPQARIAEHSQSADDASVTAVWDCTAGEFRWYFGWDETVMILEGEVVVTDANNEVRTLRAGDIAYFAGNTWATWKIENYVKKIAFVRRPFPAPVVLALKLKAMLARMKGGSSKPLRSGL